MPSNWLLFDRVRALTRRYNIYQAERVYQDQPSLDKLTAGGEFLDFNVQAAILDQTNLQINRLERYKDYEQMDQTGEISLALDLYADEACVTGDTRIPLLDGTCPTIAELAARGPESEFWVYSYDQKTSQYVPALAKGARITGRNVPIVRVTLDDGTSIRCTQNHLFMLKDGSFCRAKDLQPSDSLQPLYKKCRYRGKGGKTSYVDKLPYPTATAYEFIFDGQNFRSTHRWVYRQFHDNNPPIIHHANFCSSDNSPTNLIGMTMKEHDAIHRKLGKDNPSFNPITFEEISEAMHDWHGPAIRESIYALCKIGDRVLNRVLQEEGISWAEFRDRYNRCEKCDKKLKGPRKCCDECRRDYLHEYHQQHKIDERYRHKRLISKRNNYNAVQERKCAGCNMILPAKDFLKNGPSYSPYCMECRPKICQSRYQRKSFANHKVVSVEQCGMANEVYDIEVPKYHCFAAGSESSWVIIHNSLVDPERKHTLVIRARNRRLKKELENLFFGTLLWDNFCRPSVRYLCKYGDLPFEVQPTIQRDGVASLRFMNVYNFTRIETRFGDLVGFFYQDTIYPEPQFMHPWQVMHLRLTSFENIYHPYGRAIIDGGRKAFKQLRLMEDAALIYRITRAPEKRKFTIPVGLIPPKEVPEYMQMIARNFKRQRFYNPTTGTFDERYSPLIQEDDFFLPRRPDGTGPDIETLPGAENLDQIADIEYFKKKMIAPTKIPFARVGIGEGAGEASEKSLSQSHSEFAKAVQWVQREMATGLTKVAIIHLALKGFTVEDLRGFEIALTATSAMEELYRIETWQTRTGVMAELKDLGWFPKEWIVTHFTDLSPDEIEELKDMEVTEGEGGAGGSMPGGGMPGGLDVEPEMAEGEEGEDEEVEEDLPLEGYDRAAEVRLLKRLRGDDRINDTMKYVRKWAERLGRPTDPEERSFESSFVALMENKEFDGLSRIDPPELPRDKIHNPNYDGKGLLVEWSVDETERDAVIKEVYDLLINQAIGSSDSGDITEDDLPAAVSNL